MEERFETFTALISRISRNIKKIKNKEMAEYDLRSSHISCLYYLYCSKSLTATELCEKCDDDKATISRSLDYLEKNGYITCNSKSAKRYKSLLVLTDKGTQAGKKIADKIDLVLGRVSAELTEEELVAFYRCLTIISNNIEQISNSSIEIESSERKNDDEQN